MPTYEVNVRVDFSYEVEAEDESAAEEMGWQWEDYTHFSDVYSINVTQTSDDEEEEEDDN
jgi:hypothetical protein